MKPSLPLSCPPSPYSRNSSLPWSSSTPVSWHKPQRSSNDNMASYRMILLISCILCFDIFISVHYNRYVRELASMRLTTAIDDPSFQIYQIETGNQLGPSQPNDDHIGSATNQIDYFDNSSSSREEKRDNADDVSTAVIVDEPIDTATDDEEGAKEILVLSAMLDSALSATTANDSNKIYGDETEEMDVDDQNIDWTTHTPEKGKKETAVAMQ